MSSAPSPPYSPLELRRGRNSNDCPFRFVKRVISEQCPTEPYRTTYSKGRAPDRPTRSIISIIIGPSDKHGGEQTKALHRHEPPLALRHRRRRKRSQTELPEKKFALPSSSIPPDWRRRPQHPHTLHEQHLESRVYTARHRLLGHGMKRKDSPYRFPMQGRPIVLVRRRFVGVFGPLVGRSARIEDPPPWPSFVRPGVNGWGKRYAFLAPAAAMASLYGGELVSFA